MEKIQRLREKLSQEQVDAIIITNPYNRRYISNFTGSAGIVVISQKEAKFITDFRYVEQAGKQAVGFEIVQHKGPIQNEVAAQLKTMGAKRIGFEQDNVTFSTYKSYETVVEGELIPLSNVIENLRLIKTPQEIKILKEAADIADAAFKHIIEYLRPGLTELEVSNELEFFMRKAGATSSSFDIIVASGARSALPHGVATDKIIEHGDFVTMDYGALYNGYISDITRTVAVGEPSEELKKIYDITLESQMYAMEHIKPGMTGREADALARDIIAAKGYGEYFGHSLGHGIGLEVHEGPGLSAKSDVVLEKGMVVTCEPGIYLPGVGGVRIEDDLLITEDSNETFTHSTKDLLIL